MEQTSQNKVPLGIILIILAGVAAGLLSFGSSRTFSDTAAAASSGAPSISASPYLINGAADEVKTTTITWSGGTGATVEVYVSANGATDQLFARGPSGVQAAPWIKTPGYYVFKLYEGTAHTKLLAWTSVIGERPPKQKIGFNYWPQGFTTDMLYDKNWVSLRSVVKTDLDQISSMGGDVIRFLILPQLSGYLINGSGKGGTFDAHYAQVKRNIVDFLGMAYARGLRVVVLFGNNYFDVPTNADGTGRWWQGSYANFTDFIGDSVTWQKGIVQSIEATSTKAAVLYYDLENEYSKDHPNAGWYVTALNDWSGIPRGKRGISVLHVPDDAQDLASQIKTGGGPELGTRHFDFVDFHVYPNAPSVNANLESSYDAVQAAFPGSVVLVGEFGAQANTPTAETQQQTVDQSVIQRAMAKGVPYVLNWMLYNENLQPSTDSFGWLYSPDDPKNVVGSVVAQHNLLKNADMELTEKQCDTFGCTKPLNWTTGGSIPTTLIAGGPAQSDAATNLYYARLTAQKSNAPVWIASDLTPVRGGTKLFANAFIRSDTQKVRMSVIEYDADKKRISDTSGPPFTPATWKFYNYLKNVGSWSVTLKPNTAYIVIVISGTTGDLPAYLDIDTVSVWNHDILPPLESATK